MSLTGAYNLNKQIKINKDELSLWIKKYLSIDSSRLLLLENIKGKILNIFNSNETHNIILDLLLKEIITLIIRKILNINKGLKIIKNKNYLSKSYELFSLNSL